MNTSAPDLNNKKTRARKDGTFLRVKDLSELFRRTFVEASAFGECPQAGPLRAFVTSREVNLSR